MARSLTDEPDSARASTDVVLTVVEAARFLKVSESVVRRLIRERRIPFFKIEGRYLFYRPVLEEWMRSLTIVPDGASLGVRAQAIAEEITHKRG
jgi:excisionase family DNA binding protein